MRVPALLLAACAASTLNCPATAQPAPATAQPKPATAQPAPAEQRLAHISVVAMGSGSPVVLIPGLSSPRAVWDGIVPQLAANHRVYLVQVNGFGGDDPGANLQPGVLGGVVADLHSYLTQHKAAPASVIGHSMGGLIALMLAKAHPGDTAAVMTVDALPYVGDIFVPGATVAQLEPRAKAMRDQMVSSFGKPNPSNTAIARSMALTPGAQEKVAGWMGVADVRVSGQAMYEDLTTDLRSDMASIITPITLVMPYSDAMPKERAEPFYRAEYGKTPNLTLVPVADSGHFVMLDQPQAFAAAVARFAD
jgi:pimeloyl-ACP methyl ester carboxylesterase